jgi:hypothetical protein
MGAEVTLVLKADNTDIIRKLTETQKAQDKLFEGYTKGYKEKKGLIQQEQEELEKLLRWRLKTEDPDMVTKYNRAIDDQVKKLNELENAGRNVAQSGESATKSLGKWALGFASVATAVNLLKNAFKQTEAGLRTFNAIGAITKQILYDLVTAGKIEISHIALSIKANKEAEKVRVEQRKGIVEIAKIQTIFNKLYFEASNQTLDAAEKTNILNKALIAHQALMDKKIDNAKKELEIINWGITARPEETTLLDAQAQKLAEIETLEGERYTETKRLEQMRTGIIKDETEKQTQIREAAIKQEIKDQIDGINNFMSLRKQREKADEITRDKVREKATKKYLGLLGRVQFMTVVSEMIIKEEAEESDNKITEIHKKAIEDQKEADEDLYNHKRDLMQNAIGLGAQLFNHQFANLELNYKKEIAAAGENAKLKTEIDERYTKKRNDLARKASIAEKIAGLFSVGIDTAKGVANAASKVLTIPLIPWIIANGIVQAAIIAATPVPQYAKGGWTGRGRNRDSSGERVAGIVHEEEFVVRRGPALKFREVLDAINKNDRSLIINRFNKLSPELFGGTTINKVIVENEGPNKRLDKVNRQLELLNKRSTSEEVIEMDGATIIRKGSSTRVVRK